MLSIERCREILEAGEEVSDDEIETLQILLRSFIDQMLKRELEENETKSGGIHPSQF